MSEIVTTIVTPQKDRDSAYQELALTSNNTGYEPVPVHTLSPESETTNGYEPVPIQGNDL
jgi:hypothetical protein